MSLAFSVLSGLSSLVFTPRTFTVITFSIFLVSFSMVCLILFSALLVWYSFLTFFMSSLFCSLGVVSSIDRDYFVLFVCSFVLSVYSFILFKYSLVFFMCSFMLFFPSFSSHMCRRSRCEGVWDDSYLLLVSYLLLLSLPSSYVLSLGWRRLLFSWADVWLSSCLYVLSLLW